MTDGIRDRVRSAVHDAARSAGRTYERARREFNEGQSSRLDLPRDDDGNARIVCRRYAERRAVRVDGQGRPECFDAGHPDCEGCAEDVRDGRVETW